VAAGRLGEREPLTGRELVEQLGVDEHAIEEALGQLRERSLVEGRDDGTIALTEPGRDDYERLVAARCARLAELLAGWRPDQELELRQLVDRLGRDLVSAIPTPPTVPAAS
jgi:DNA-binding MarR family transcriptional regulator